MSNNGTLTFVPNGGLGNRMRAIASAYALMQQTGVSVRTVWIADWTLGAPFATLFKPIREQGFTVEDASLAQKMLYDHPRKHNLWLPRLPQALLFQQRIDDYEVTPLKQQSFDFNAWATGRRSYMSCYQEFGRWNAADYAKLFRPTDEVETLLRQYTRDFATTTIGFHVRRTDHTQATQRSPLSLFVAQAERELSADPQAKIFLATDDDATKQELSSRFGTAIITPPSGTYSRETVAGMRAALAEMLALSRTKIIYGCAESTYPVVASRMSGTPLKVLALKQ